MRRVFITVAMLIANLGGGLAHAVPVAFTDRATFDTAVLAFQDPETVNFDGALANTLIASGAAFGDITFDYTIGTSTLKITDAWGTSSSPNSLGLDSADDAFRGGDAFDMTFDRIVHALGLYVVGEDIFAGDLTLSVGTGGSVSNDDGGTFSGGQIFFLGLIDTDGFTTAGLSSFAESYVFNVDDIYTAVFSEQGTAVPEPTTLALCATGAIGLIAWRRRASARRG